MELEIKNWFPTWFKLTSLVIVIGNGDSDLSSNPEQGC